MQKEVAKIVWKNAYMHLKQDKVTFSSINAVHLFTVSELDELTQDLKTIFNSKILFVWSC